MEVEIASNIKPEYVEKIRAYANRKPLSIKTIINDRIFLFGLIQIIIWTMISVLLMNQVFDICDMNEMVYEANWYYLLKGINPYGQDYTIQIFEYVYPHDYFPYGPMILFIYLPASLLPPDLAQLGTMDFMPSFYAMNMFFVFCMYANFRRHQDHSFAYTLWFAMGPIWVFICIGSFLPLPMLLIQLGYYNIKNHKSLLYFGIGLLVYQYVLMFFIFAFIYHLDLKWEKIKKLLIYVLPIFIPVIIFLIWDVVLGRIGNLLGDSFIGNFLFGQLTRKYVGWGTEWARGMPWLFIFSIPAIVYNLTGGFMGGPGLQIGFYATIVAVAIIGVLGVYFLIKKGHDNLFTFPILALFAMLLTNITGMGHYYLLQLIPMMMVFRHRYEIFSYFKEEKK